MNIEGITDADYIYAKRVCKDFKIKHLGEYQIYILKVTLLLVDVFQNFTNTCWNIYELDPAKFLSVPGLAWQAALKKIEVKLELLTDIDMLSLAVEKGISRGICHAVHRYSKANNKYMKDYDKNRESSYPKHCVLNNLYGWTMLQNFPVHKCEWIKDTFQFHKDFIKDYNKESDEGYFHKVDVKYPEKYAEVHTDLPFLLENWKIRKACC